MDEEEKRRIQEEVAAIPDERVEAEIKRLQEYWREKTGYSHIMETTIGENSMYGVVGIRDDKFFLAYMGDTWRECMAWGFANPLEKE